MIQIFLSRYIQHENGRFLYPRINYILHLSTAKKAN